MNNNVITTTLQERKELLKNNEIRLYRIFIHHPGGEWVCRWGEVTCDSAPSYNMFRDFLEESELEDHLESLEHNTYSGNTPTPSEFVHALTFPECIEFKFVPLTGNEYQDWLESEVGIDYRDWMD